MYSLQGFEALMRAVSEQVCQSLMVVSNCMPGSPQAQADLAIWSMTSRALKRSIGRPSLMACVVQSPSSSTARMKASETRTLLLEFWKNTDAYASPSRRLS